MKSKLAAKTTKADPVFMKAMKEAVANAVFMAQTYKTNLTFNDKGKIKELSPAAMKRRLEKLK
ncbi:MAG: hypothetical protein DI586_08645 [Micavibrio aeruginosavorus]|uniref:Uncharacterized protein n=1 Tax=Micavibrio aeruginosavorus TaxID=349221 RepID=A0A2W5HM22_9BACT|nr:MAG: hypothetical protein DI586_08645 [Micavibrio aeruginosavorus]